MGPAKRPSAGVGASASATVWKRVPDVPAIGAVPVLNRCKFKRSCVPFFMRSATPGGGIVGGGVVVVGGGVAGGVVADGDGLPVPVFSAEPQAANSATAPKMSAHSVGVQRRASDFMRMTLPRRVSRAKRQLQTIS